MEVPVRVWSHTVAGQEIWILSVDGVIRAADPDRWVIIEKAAPYIYSRAHQVGESA